MPPVAADYGRASRLLHRLALGSDMIASASLELESLTTPPLAGSGPPVFVCGLARAGTTLLMRLLYDSGPFCSLTYRDMPFVLAPNLWARLRGETVRKGGGERAHADGIDVDVESPEALEEVFWRVHCRDQYIRPDRLLPMTASEEVLDAYRTFVGHVLRRYGGGRYLAKNNNNLLRLDSLQRAFPEAILLVPFRDPVNHARSLLAQHRRFCRLQADDPFIGRYMTWLVHHEFGLDHRTFDWVDCGADSLPGRELAQDSVDYWLAQWCAAYSFALARLEQPGLDVVLVDYDALCRTPTESWSRIASRVGLQTSAPLALVVRATKVADEAGCDAELLARARDIHIRLVAGS